MNDPRETLAHIRRQADAAAEGPWVSNQCEPCAERDRLDVTVWGRQGNALVASWCDDDEYDPANAEFIAAARTDVPRLVDALEKVLELHVRAECPTCGSRDGEGNEFHKCDDDAYCEECDLEGYPCPTVEAITTALDAIK